VIDLAALEAVEKGERHKTDSAGNEQHVFPTLRVVGAWEKTTGSAARRGAQVQHEMHCCCCDPMNYMQHPKKSHIRERHICPLLVGRRNRVRETPLRLTATPCGGLCLCWVG